MYAQNISEFTIENFMKPPIQIVLVEDNPNDVEILRYELTKGGLSFVLTVVDNEKNFRSALSQSNPDIVISDYSLPMFSGHLALEITKTQCSEEAVITY
jgi:two-component system sensor histidine kinase UhpB